MKKILLAVFVLFAFAAVSNAQTEGDFRLNGGLAYGSEAGFDGGGAGINVGLEYFFTDVISAAPSYTYFFESTEDVLGTEFSARLSSINIDGRYYFQTDGFQAYGLAGIAILAINTTTPDFFGTGTIETSDSETGLNIGAGIVYPLSEKIGLNGQLKYQTPGEGQLVLNAGVAIALN